LYYDDFVAPTWETRKLLPVDEIKSMPQLMTERAFANFYDNRACYVNIIKNYGRMEFIDLVISLIEPMNREIYMAHGLKGDELEFVAFYVASTNAMLFLRWAEDGFKESPKRLAKRYITWVMRHFRDLEDQP
jgi:hypothetical protein